MTLIAMNKSFNNYYTNGIYYKDTSCQGENVLRSNVTGAKFVAPSYHFVIRNRSLKFFVKKSRNLEFR